MKKRGWKPDLSESPPTLLVEGGTFSSGLWVRSDACTSGVGLGKEFEILGKTWLEAGSESPPRLLDEGPHLNVV